MNLVDYVVTQFTSEELHEVAKTIGVRLFERWGNRQLVEELLARLSKGIPDTFNSLIDNFLYVAHVTDRNGNIQEEDSTEVEVSEEELTQISNCFGYASDLDSKCSSCLMYASCASDLMLNLPDCYGLNYQEGECGKCLVKNTCLVGFNVKSGRITKGWDELYFFKEIPILTNLLEFLSLFRGIYRAWPKKVIIKKPNRLSNISIRGAELGFKSNIFRDCIVFEAVKPGSDLPERKPLIFDNERRPLLDHENLIFRKRYDDKTNSSS